MRGPDSPSK
jgi:hypothetical protein